MTTEPRSELMETEIVAMPGGLAFREAQPSDHRTELHVIEIPDGCELLVMRPHRDGTYQVTLRVTDGIGLCIATGWGPTALDASRSAAERMPPLIEEQTRLAADREARYQSSLNSARSRAAAAAAGFGRPSPEGTGRAGRPPSPARPAGSAKARPPRPAGAVTGWTDSVPREAAEWHVAADRTVRVVLWPDLMYADGSGEKVHRTVRLAKDETRAALPRPPEPTVAAVESAQVVYRTDLFD